MFGFFKKKNKKVELNTPASFYNECVADFHKEAVKYGVAKRGVSYIPELLPLGENKILAYLKDPFFQMQSAGHAQQYYYLIMVFR